MCSIEARPATGPILTKSLLARTLFVSTILLALPFLHKPLMAQVCEQHFTLQNKDRHVYGPVNTECEPTIHSVPFGNWGVETCWQGPVDGGQFQGWCDENVNEQCRPPGDPRVEWNSCTSQFPPPNCAYYNYNGCWEQFTTKGVNNYVHDYHEESTSCPEDIDGEGICDIGGCESASSFEVPADLNYMILKEHDPPFTWPYITTLWFPYVAVSTTCKVDGRCDPAFSEWVESKANPVAKAKMRAYFRGASFDERGGCWTTCSY